MKKIFGIVSICLLALLFVYLHFYYRWKPLWSLAPPKKAYHIAHHQDDTLRIVIIGDSWVGMRTDTINSIFKSRLSESVGRPVIIKSKGKGGEKSRGIYQLMFEDEGMGTKSLFSSGSDYCVVIAGINDAAANLGKNQFTHHIKLIIDFLLENGVRPILIEIPNVDIWNVYGGKPVKDLVVDYARSLMTGCGMYHYSEYRDALQLMLEDSKLMDSVIIVSMNSWNEESPDINKHFFLNDKIHLNHQGYCILDSCIIDAINQDLQTF